MKLVTIGDSITRGSYTGINDPCPMSVANPNFSELLRQKLGFDDLKCCGINGVSISATSHQNPDYAISKNYDNVEDGDFLIIAGGTNDYGTDVILGTSKDTDDVSFYGALYVLYSKVIKRMPKEKVVVIIPINREYDDKNHAGFTLEQYRQAIIERANEFGFFLVDGRKMAIDPKDPVHQRQLSLMASHNATPFASTFLYNCANYIKS